MDHSQAVEQMAAERYLLNELTPEAREAFEEHFFDCPECAMDLRAAAAFVDEAKAQLPALISHQPASPINRLAQTKARFLVVPQPPRVHRARLRGSVDGHRLSEPGHALRPARQSQPAAASCLQLTARRHPRRPAHCHHRRPRSRSLFSQSISRPSPKPNRAPSRTRRTPSTFSTPRAKYSGPAPPRLRRPMPPARSASCSSFPAPCSTTAHTP